MKWMLGENNLLTEIEPGAYLVSRLDSMVHPVWVLSPVFGEVLPTEN